MMETFLTDILADPESGSELVYSSKENQLRTINGDKTYPVIDDVPVLLTQRSSQAIASTELHNQFKTSFNYTDHYQVDSEVYDYFKKEINLATRNEIKRLHEAIINAVPGKASLIMDVGCGNGWVAKHFLSMNKKVISVDISSNNPVKALKENPSKNHAAIVADTFNLPIKKNSVDCVIAAEIMEHVQDPKLFIESLLAILIPGGRLIITTPYNEKLEYFLCVHCNKLTPKNAHLHSFNEEKIKAIVPMQNINYRTKRFSNKYMTRLRLYAAMSFLPYKMWDIIDKLINAVINKPERLLIEINKNQ